MSVRRVLVATSVACALLASGSAEAAKGYSLDGRRVTKKTWKATLLATSFPSTLAATSDPLAPSLADCSKDTCDVSELRLSLPKGTSYGRLTARVAAQRQTPTALALYNRKGELITYRESLTEGTDDAERFEYYVVELSQDWVPKGTYTLAVHNRFGGASEIEAEVVWVAKRPDRRTDLAQR